MKIKTVSFDTMCIIDAAQSLESLLYINKKWNFRHEIPMPIVITRIALLSAILKEWMLILSLPGTKISKKLLKRKV
jgi:hypothetical protein